ncbi:hypothetical protein FVE85_5993 [Porphyridium purpureum]|uniref:Uncharacterized protein n=1 Tax=Porphyridium purpureum TaxID=35688 RepID=A0A5J4Z5B7_PORPP|nr:hypothetical protein FVE85_5993 [Porphyridium purpureum]|eukprot:POR5378..scf295_1
MSHILQRASANLSNRRGVVIRLHKRRGRGVRTLRRRTTWSAGTVQTKTVKVPQTSASLRAAPAGVSPSTLGWTCYHQHQHQQRADLSPKIKITELARYRVEYHKPMPFCDFARLKIKCRRAKRVCLGFTGSQGGTGERLCAVQLETERIMAQEGCEEIMYRANSKFSSSINLRASLSSPYSDEEDAFSFGSGRVFTRKTSPGGGLRTVLSRRASPSSPAKGLKRRNKDSGLSEPDREQECEPAMPMTPSRRNCIRSESVVSLLVDEYTDFSTVKRKALLEQLKDRCSGLMRKRRPVHSA